MIISRSVKYVALLHIIVTHKSDFTGCCPTNVQPPITKLQKLYSLPRNLRTGNKSPALFLEKPLCTGDLSPVRKIFIERPAILLQILHHSSLSWHIIPLWILSSYFFYFGLKDPIQIPILRQFWEFTYSSCHFPNHKSVFLQILHHSSVSWKITPLYFFFRSNIKYFAHFSL